MSEKRVEKINLTKQIASFVCENCDSELEIDFSERDVALRKEGAKQELEYIDKLLMEDTDDQICLAKIRARVNARAKELKELEK